MPAIRGNGAEDGDKDSRKIELRRERETRQAPGSPIRFQVGAARQIMMNDNIIMIINAMKIFKRQSKVPPSPRRR